VTSKFEDIKIKGMDDAASYKPDPNEELFNIVLNLSAHVPYEWADIFSNRWRFHFYMKRRIVSVSGNALHIICVLDELEKDHIPELKKVVDETNQEYRKYLKRKQTKKRKRKQLAEEEKKQLSYLKKNIKFD